MSPRSPWAVLVVSSLQTRQSVEMNVATSAVKKCADVCAWRGCSQCAGRCWSEVSFDCVEDCRCRATPREWGVHQIHPRRLWCTAGAADPIDVDARRVPLYSVRAVGLRAGRCRQSTRATGGNRHINQLGHRQAQVVNEMDGARAAPASHSQVVALLLADGRHCQSFVLSGSGARASHSDARTTPGYSSRTAYRYSRPAIHD